MKTACAIALSFGMAAAANAATITGTTYTYSTGGPDADAAYYLDDTGTQLTDGLFVGDTVTEPTPGDESVGWQLNTSTNIDFDLGGSYDVDSVTIGHTAYNQWQKYGPDDVQILGSTDGIDFSTDLTGGFVGGFTAFGAPYDYQRADNVITITGTAAYTHIRISFNGGADDSNPETGEAANGYLLDEISIDGTIVPEPSSAALLGLGGLALILRRRK